MTGRCRTWPSTTTCCRRPVGPAADVGRRRALTEQAAEAAIDQACRQLRLPTVRTQVAEVVAAAEREQLSYRGFLAELLLAECDDREHRRSARRIKAAGFPREKWLADFDFAANPAINPATISTLASCAWVKVGEPLCLIGDSGTGKTHLLIALGTAAAAPSCSSRSSPSARRPPAWRLPPTRASPAGPRPSPTRDCAPRSWTGSPSPATSSRPAPAPTAWPTPAANGRPQGPRERDRR